MARYNPVPGCGLTYLDDSSGAILVSDEMRMIERWLNMRSSTGRSCHGSSTNNITSNLRPGQYEDLTDDSRLITSDMEYADAEQAPTLPT
eukprot:1993050-Pyramimonas_sp.AAC.1